MVNKHKVLGPAVAAVVAGLTAVETSAATYTWNYGGTDTNSLKWETASSWTKPEGDVPDPPPGSSDIAHFDSGPIAGAQDRTLSLNGDWTISALTAIASGTGTQRSFILTGGSLTLLTGNITIEADGIASAKPVNFANITLQVGDGMTPVTNAVWTFNNSNNTKQAYQIGSVRGIAGTTITVQGSNTSNWNASSDDYKGTIVLSQTTGTAGVNLTVNASNALGGAGSQVIVASPQRSNLLFNSTSPGTPTTHAMNIRVDTELAIAVGTNSASGPISKVTLEGTLSGAGSLIIGRLPPSSTAYFNTHVVLAGTGHTLSGLVSIDNGGRLEVNGDWTGAGNITISRGMLMGSGSIGMAEGKKVDIRASSSVDGTPAGINPGGEGTVGTLTLGTVGNNNVVNFINSSGGTRETQLVIDIDGDTADSLLVNGNLTIGNTGTYLVFNEISAPTADMYVLASWTGTLTGTFSDITALPAGGSVEYDLDNKQIVLHVPEPSTLSVVCLGAAALLRRRTRPLVGPAGPAVKWGSGKF